MVEKDETNASAFQEFGLFPTGYPIFHICTNKLLENIMNNSITKDLLRGIHPELLSLCEKLPFTYDEFSISFMKKAMENNLVAGIDELLSHF